MHKTVYIDVDEEITSVLDRIRQETVVNIFLVVPKEAMLLNSIINLKLLKKEAEKMGKIVSIVSPNDNRAKTMIERAGIKAEDYNKAMNEQQLQAAAVEGSMATEQIDRAIGESVEETNQQLTRGGLDVGSNSFFARKSNHGQSDVNPIQNQTEIVQPRDMYQQNNVSQGNLSQDRAEQIDNQQENDKFSYFKEDNKKYEKSTQKGVFSQLIKSKIVLIPLIILVVVIFGAAGWYWANYPKLTLAIKPLNKSIDKEIKIIAKNDIDDIDVKSGNIPGEYMEISLKKTMEFESTGDKVVDKNGAKAKGTVVIENSLIAKPQKLVKTTRIISEDGKLFRLTKNVIVPGMKNDIPGKIEVTVEADKPGKEFNIAKGSFVIAAWRGTPKGEKFNIFSKQSMVGGITSVDSKTQKIVNKADLNKARKKTLEALDNSLVEELTKRLNQGQTVVESSIEKEIVSSKASHLEGTIADKFSYTVVYNVKVIAFEEEDVKEIVREVVQSDVGKKYALEQNFKVEAKRGIVDLDKKTITIYVDIDGTAWFEIDKDKLKKSIAGQNSEITRMSLSKDVGVRSAEIKPSPAWSNKAPKNLDKITIEIVK